MNFFKILFPGLLLSALAGCTVASGPIKAYPSDAAVDPTQLSILYLPPEVELLEADGMETATPYITSGYNEVHLLPGRHQLAVKYVEFWGDADSGSMVKSAPVIFSLVTVPKAKYYLKYKKPGDQWEAQAMAGKFSPWLEDEQGARYNIKQIRYGTKALTSGSPSMTTAAAPYADGGSPLDKLKYWWKQAGYKEKKAFEQWMNAN